MNKVITKPIANEEKPKESKFKYIFSGTFLTFVLIILKAFEIIDISWLWVFAPLWIPTIIILGIILIAIIGVLIFG